MKWKKITKRTKFPEYKYFLICFEAINEVYFCSYKQFPKMETIKLKDGTYTMKLGKKIETISMVNLDRNEVTTKDLSEIKLWDPAHYLIIPSSPMKKNFDDIVNHGINCPPACECHNYKEGFNMAVSLEDPIGSFKYLNQNLETYKKN